MNETERKHLKSKLVYRYALINNALIASAIIVISLGVAYYTKTANGVWSILLSYFFVMPSYKKDSDKVERLE